MSQPRTPTLITFLLAVLPSTTFALPISHLLKRELSTGAKAGLGIGIAVAALFAVLLIVFVAIHIRRSRHLAQLNKERAILAGEKNQDGSDKPDKFAPEPVQSSIPRRNKSVKDRLMGPLYRGSTIDLEPVPKAATRGGNRTSTFSTFSLEGLPRPWTRGENSPRPSFSSKRATRMMMMM
ncbi:hypothetical protein EDD37DRAFT_434058 [Exophiala viscosa]|uniref:Uncharacterized protein n=1 Tax=Exophiala viscosa TaxID=2486360 RepID=A0AAN6DST7_9EURO|nr:hypothetical protein EDD36DRAFT_289454 [Exophiala viscosa]KAI1623700.1 hypothetical protein EDD37DRAFT_434058 [Exophiala viscosa]